LVSLAALAGIFVLLAKWVSDGISLMDGLGAVVAGGAIWAGILLALQEIRSRLALAPIPNFLRKPNDGPITVLVILLMALGFYALWEVYTIDPTTKLKNYPLQQIGIVGALVAIAGGAMLWAREITKPVYEITIANDTNKLYLPAGSRLMPSLKANGYVLFAQCGGKGTCATCRCKIPDGLPSEKRTPTMYGPLNEKLRGEGWILSCQIEVHSDMTVELFKPLVQKWPAPPAAVTAGRPTAPSA
jgi:ferredoxin